MIYVALAQSVVIVLLAAAIFLRERDRDRQIHDLHGSFVAERKELINHMKRPEYLSAVGTPAPPRPRDVRQEIANRRMAAVGTIGEVPPMPEEE